MKVEAKTPEEELSDVEISNLLVMIVKMLKELGRRIDKLNKRQNF